MRAAKRIHPGAANRIRLGAANRIRLGAVELDRVLSGSRALTLSDRDARHEGRRPLADAGEEVA
jgi:hypothetical protein